jgi:hypothetical protein
VRPVSVATSLAGPNRPCCSSVISSGTSAPTSPPIRAVLTASTHVDPSTNANTTYSAAADRPPMIPSSASTAMKVIAACPSSGLISRAPAPSAAMYPATISDVATMPPPFRLADSVNSASS